MNRPGAEPSDRELLLAILARLDRLERTVAAGTASVPKRLTRRQVAAQLGVSTRTVSVYAARGLLIRLPKPVGAGKSTPTYYDPANVSALATSEDHAREWVARRKYVSAGRRKG